MDLNDDHLVAEIIAKSMHDNREYFTQTKLTAYYNLVERTLRLYAISCPKEDVFALIDDMAEKLKKNLEFMWSDDYGNNS